uniref:Putative secreted protein n=1 Tax=Anopheles darlingi TaxID=43151 RepID=A0A2M4DDA1_ANODA
MLHNCLPTCGWGWCVVVVVCCVLRSHYCRLIPVVARYWSAPQFCFVWKEVVRTSSVVRKWYFAHLLPLLSPDCVHSRFVWNGWRWGNRRIRRN